MTEREEPLYGRRHAEVPPDYPSPGEGTGAEGGQIAWDDDDCGKDRPAFVPIVSPRPDGAGVSGMFVSDRFEAVWTHWYDFRTGPHVEPSSICAGCRARRPKRRKGYALTIDGTMKLNLLEITQEVLRLAPFLTSSAAALRGRRFRAVRLGNDRNSRVVLDVKVYQPGDSELLQNLPPIEPIRPYLLRIWGL